MRWQRETFQISGLVTTSVYLWQTDRTMRAGQEVEVVN